VIEAIRHPQGAERGRFDGATQRVALVLVAGPTGQAEATHELHVHLSSSSRTDAVDVLVPDLDLGAETQAAPLVEVRSVQTEALVLEGAAELRGQLERALVEDKVLVQVELVPEGGGVELRSPGPACTGSA